jgi:thiamine-phosphate pyrophosphorylase
MKLHAIVSDLETARRAVEGGATVVQLRLKGASTEEVVETGRPFRELPATFVVNDDVEAAIELRADGVHLGQSDPGADRALAAGLLLGTSAVNVTEARAGEELGSTYIGAGPIWETPSKPDADPPIGLDGLAEICAAVSIPVVAIGGIDAGNAAECLVAGATGVAAGRAAADAGRVREAIDEALSAR